MKKPRIVVASALLALVVIAVPIFTVGAPDTFLWEADVSSQGGSVPSPVLEAGREYRIVARGVFVSQNGTTWLWDHAADAQYYTPDPSDWWVWDVGNTFSAPGGHSFLQIDGGDVNWGPFSNGQIIGGAWSGHEYTIYYIGTGAPITFAIVDWIDLDYSNNWSHFHVEIYESPPPPPPPAGETAFAYGGPDYATCFLSMDFDGNGKRDFKNWGWSNGPLPSDPVYNFDIWAGAARCNLNKGELVGTLTIDYDGSTATVTYTMDAGYMMQNTQLYVGSEPLPRDSDGDYTVSPGQYPYIHLGINAASDTYMVTGLSGDIYVVAHADVVEV